MFCQKMTKLADRRFVERGLVAQVDTDKTPDRQRVVRRLLDSRITQRIPLRQEMDPQRALKADRPTAALGDRLRVERLDDRTQVCSRHNLVHLG